LEMQAPQPKPPGAWQDTFFISDAVWPKEVVTPVMDDPRTLLLGHFGGRMPLSVSGSGRRGQRINRLIDRQFGAQQFSLIRGELANGGFIPHHDHAIEECYFFVSGEAEMEIEGKRYHFRAGGLAWTGVGANHAFFQKGDSPLCWIETQAPQPPTQDRTRIYADWDKLRNLYNG
jgi:mannose-6-phosphate isomerase-like protein (cupin superfamily)